MNMKYLTGRSIACWEQTTARKLRSPDWLVTDKMPGGLIKKAAKLQN